jgi:pimeloyl-ACP methyl ester carboxylesterase
MPLRAHRRPVRANGVELCIETFGDPSSPAVLLIAGGASPMDWWEDELCERLAAGQRFVIRYDHRDTGQSVSYEPGAPEYDGADLVADAVGILDALEIERAHLVGLSAGGGIAQQAALVYPERVASLTLIATSPAVGGGRDLPGPSDELRVLFANPPPPPDWADREAVVDYIVEDLRAYEGRFPLEEERVRPLAGRIFDRTSNIESTYTNHFAIGEGDPVRGTLGDIAAPTLVIHGTEDPLFPLAHGEALAREIPRARLLPLEGMGHEVPPRQLWDLVVGAILGHTSAPQGQASA